MEKNATIIPIASGKGGVGKTFLTANLGMALAERGHQTVVVDLDLGSCNLFSFLEMPNRFAGLGAFLKAGNLDLQELLVATNSPNLFYLAGDGKTPLMANIAYVQKIKLMRHICKLQADYILLDLGAGSSFNALDFFGIASQGLLVTVAEHPAIMSMLVFLKNFMLRSIWREIGKNEPLRQKLHGLLNEPIEQQSITMEKLQREMASEYPQTGQIVDAITHHFRPRIVFNLGEHPDELKITRHVDERLKEVLSLEADYFGFIYNEADVKQAIRARTSYFPTFRQNRAAESIAKIATRIEQYWNQPVSNSAQLIWRHAQQDYQTSA